jgi:transcriptional repressor NrdR
MAVRKRKIDDEKIKAVVNEIAKELETQGVTEIPSKDIGEIVLEKLKTLDRVSFVRFASVYKNFENTKDFMNFIKDIK